MNISPSSEKRTFVNPITIGLILVALLAIGISVFHNTKTSQPDTQSSNVVHKELQAIYDKIPTQSGKANFLKQSNNLTKKVDPELIDLDSQIITCDANVDNLMSASPSYGNSCVSGEGGKLVQTNGLYMGGQCCSPLMDTDERHKNLKNLQEYKSMPNIPLDPMRTPIAMAKQWIDYDNSTTLTPNEQKIYDQVYAISKEKPCCCKCWHYYTNEGIAKKMIKDGTFNSKQIADYWDASDICGA